ncbi:hypothetical protein BsWGS_23728 [Bradybaena similaris]
MDKRPNAPRAQGTESIVNTLSKLNISKQDLKLHSVMPDAHLESSHDNTVPEVRNAVWPVNEFRRNESDVLETTEAAKIKQTVDNSILNAKQLYELSNPSGAKEKTAKEVNRKGGLAKPRSPTRNKDQHLGPSNRSKANSKSTRNGTSLTVSEILHPAKSKKTSHVFSLSTKLKKAISFGPGISKTRSASFQATGTKNQQDTKGVTNMVQPLAGTTSVSSASLHLASKHKNISPKTSKKSSLHKRVSKKTSVKKGKSDAPLTENTFFTTMKTVDSPKVFKKTASGEKISRSTKKRNKSTTRLKASTSEVKPKRSHRMATSSTHRLPASPSPRPSLPRSMSRLSGTEDTKLFHKTAAASKLSSSKSATSTMRPVSVMSKPRQKPITSTKSVSVSKVNELSHRSLSVMTEGKPNTTNSPAQMSTRLALRLDKPRVEAKSPKKRSSSPLLLREGVSDTKKLKSKVNKSKSKLLSNANANNVNSSEEDGEAEALESCLLSADSPILGCTNTQTKFGEYDSPTRVSFDELVALSGQIDERNNSVFSKYTPQEPITINIGKLIGKPIVNSHSYENKNTNFSSKITYNSNSRVDGSRIYRMCFMDLVRNGIDEDVFEPTNDIRSKRLPKSDRKSVRFNVHLAEKMFRNLRNGLNTFEPAKCGGKMKRHQTSAFSSGDTDRFAQLQRRLSAAHSRETNPQSICKYGEKAFPNIWLTALKSKKWRELHSLVNSAHLDAESGSDTEIEPSEGPVGMQFPNSAQRSFSQGHLTVKTQKMVRGRQRSARARRQRRGRGGPAECRPEEVIFPPYTQSFIDEDIPHPSEERVSNATSSFLESDFVDVNASKNSDGAEQTPVPRLPRCLRKKQSQFQLKWLLLIECITKEAQRECLLKGYEILQRLSRGSPRVHSLVFLANNKSNQKYSPVEITAIRWPYACFTSSVISLEGSAADRQYIQTWVDELPPHPNLVMLLHRFCTAHWVYHVTQHCPWPSLEHLIRQSSKRWGYGANQGLRENACKTIFKQICAGIGHLHQHEILHGDLNCSNVLVSNMLQVKLAGYGPVCQRMMSPMLSVKGHVQLQGDSYSVSTPPELMARRDVWTKSCDVWCMGITLLQMTIGEIPHEISSAIRLNGCSNPVAKLHLPNCGYQLSRLIDKILQPIGANRPSVFQISNHPWLCDGTDLATVLWQRKNKYADRRTDGSTFPLPKRLQNSENRSPENFFAYSESDCSVSDNSDILGSQDINEDDTYFNNYESDYLTNLQKEPTPLNTTYYRYGLSNNWQTNRNSQISSFSSSTLLPSSTRQRPFFLKSLSPQMSFISSGMCSPRRDIMSFVNDNLEIKGTGMMYRNSAMERHLDSRIPQHKISVDCLDEKHRGCDLLKLMENLLPLDRKIETDYFS